ncbi:FMR1-interacting protein NUFIP1 [Zeugodacus cucurbitae]|uniref:FMR1-interacting protein NUFIP1 n=1 Tax=Zeugodacus cucurbitae TaxID=28588 RepID=UPI0023D93306|nr:FMR1-interacting protein NUFIP1 [Zeugodacus cucurbitae]
MADPQKFVLPSPNFNKKMEAPLARPHFLTPSGMTLHARHQPPPMYGKRGATYPSKYLQKANKNNLSPVQVEKTDTAGPEYCEACDMELQSNDDLRRHKLQHEKCPVDNCNYRGHPSVMDKHVATLHSSGLFDKFKKLSSPEEIAAWREERKRKYPTVENSIMRQRAKEQREKRGERLEAHKSRFGKQEDRKRAQKNQGPDSNQRGKHNQQQNLKNQNQNGHEKRKRNNNKRRKKEEVQKLEEKKQNDVIASIKSTKRAENNADEDINCNGISMFKGTSKLAKYQHAKPKKTKETNVLSSLLGMYGSDEDSEDDSSKNETDNEDSEHLNDDELNETISTDITMKEKDLLNSSMGTQSGSSFKVEKIEEIESENIHDSSTSFEEVQPLQNIDMEINCDTSEPSLIEKCESVSDSLIDTAQSPKPQATDLVCSDDEAPEEAPIARSTDLPSPTKSSQQNVRRNDAVNNESNQSSSKPIKKADKLSRVNKQKSGLDYRKARLRKQNTLLEKLLEPDIRHERNVLLQCLRYVCENNFFGIGEKN